MEHCYKARPQALAASLRLGRSFQIHIRKQSELCNIHARNHCAITTSKMAILVDSPFLTFDKLRHDIHSAQSALEMGCFPRFTCDSSISSQSSTFQGGAEAKPTVRRTARSTARSWRQWISAIERSSGCVPTASVGTLCHSRSSAEGL